MSCTYASIEIQRTPQFRVFKRCLFYNKPCTEVRASRMCPLLRQTPPERPEAIGGEPGEDKEMLNEELRRFDTIPSVGADFRSTDSAQVESGPRATEKPAQRAPSEAELLEAELSDFMNKMEPGKEEKPSMAKESAVGRGQAERRKRKETA